MPDSQMFWKLSAPYTLTKNFQNVLKVIVRSRPFTTFTFWENEGRGDALKTTVVTGEEGDQWKLRRKTKFPKISFALIGAKLWLLKESRFFLCENAKNPIQKFVFVLWNLLIFGQNVLDVTLHLFSRTNYSNIWKNLFFYDFQIKKFFEMACFVHILQKTVTE